MTTTHLALTEQELAETLLAAVEANEDYERRYTLVYTALAMALHLGYKAGVRLDEDAPDWPVVYIQLPQGQVSWHMPMHAITWDYHTAEEKFRRIAAYAESVHL